MLEVTYKQFLQHIFAEQDTYKQSLLHILAGNGQQHLSGGQPGPPKGGGGQ